MKKKIKKRNEKTNRERAWGRGENGRMTGDGARSVLEVRAVVSTVHC